MWGQGNMPPWARNLQMGNDLFPPPLSPLNSELNTIKLLGVTLLESMRHRLRAASAGGIHETIAQKIYKAWATTRWCWWILRNNL